MSQADGAVLFQMHVLHVLSFVIERVGSEIRPYISSLVQYLPLLWQESAEHNMLRCAILTTLIHLVQVREVSWFPCHCYGKNVWHHLI